MKNDFNISPSRYAFIKWNDDTLPLDDAIILLKETREEATEAYDRLKNVLKNLGFDLE